MLGRGPRTVTGALGPPRDILCLVASSPRSRRAVAGAAALLIGTGLAACASGDTPTYSPSPEGSSSSSSTALDQPAQQPYHDLYDLFAALPNPKDMPDKTWRNNNTGLLSFTTGYEPDKCAGVTLASGATKGFADDHQLIRASAHYAQKDSDGGDSIDIHLESHDEPYPLEFFDDAGSRLAECPEYTQTFTNDPSRTYTTSSVATPTLGERTFGVRLETPEGLKQDHLYVRSGHNLVVVILTTEGGYDERMLQKYARFVLDNLGN